MEFDCIQNMMNRINNASSRKHTEIQAITNRITTQTSDGIGIHTHSEREHAYYEHISWMSATSTMNRLDDPLKRLDDPLVVHG